MLNDVVKNKRSVQMRVSQCSTTTCLKSKKRNQSKIKTKTKRKWQQIMAIAGKASRQTKAVTEKAKQKFTLQRSIKISNLTETF